TGEAVHLARIGATVSLAGAHDVRPLADGAERGQVLPPGELLEVSSLCRAAMSAARALMRHVEEAPLLASLGSGVSDLSPLRTLIEDAVDEGGQVRDSASPELTQIRRELAEAHSRLQQRLQAMLASGSLTNALQEPII